MENKLHHFYHIYADGQWLDPVKEHIRALKESGLYDALTSFHIGIVGTPDNRLYLRRWLSDNDVNYTLAAEADTGWEQETQIPMHTFSQTNDGYILYAHSKGSYNNHEVNVRWRRSMIYWNVKRWKDVMEKLKTHDAVGCHWIRPLITGMPEHTPGNWMFAGTFFWVKAEQMRTWPKPALTHRHEAEGFPGYGWHQKNYPVYDFTPYFPNTGPFADDWVNNPNANYSDIGKSYPI